MAVGPIEHLVVLMLENRSFDHMLGFLDHPDARFHRLGDDPEAYSNLDDPLDPNSPRTCVSDDAGHTTEVNPPHSQTAVMEQMGVRADGVPRMDGFIAACGRHTSTGQREVMRCMAPAKVPVLSTLAQEFAVCTNWFASVPGETWPNRTFAHCATAEKSVNVLMRFYLAPTVFELLEPEATWSIYFDGRCQSWAFPALWATKERRARWRQVSAFEDDVSSGRLAHYVFIEPDQFEADSRCQHPSNNRPETAGADFLRAEQLIAYLYDVLKANPDIFDRTLLVILHDEHGGFYDHVPPPTDVPAPPPLEHSRPPSPSQGQLQRPLGMLGPRVPAVVVSPRIPPGTLDDETHDHSSVVATARALFSPHSSPLTPRDAAAKTFHHLATLETGRRGSELPEVRPLALPAGAVPGDIPRRLDDEFTTLLRFLGGRVKRELARMLASGSREEPAAESIAQRVDDDDLELPAPAEDDDDVVELFREAADEARRPAS
jgi:phospholipase C